MNKQVNVGIPESLRMNYYDKCNREGQVYTTTLALILEKYVNMEYIDIFDEDE